LNDAQGGRRAGEGGELLRLDLATLGAAQHITDALQREVGQHHQRGQANDQHNQPAQEHKTSAASH
jgi:hypothetical protein